MCSYNLCIIIIHAYLCLEFNYDSSCAVAENTLQRPEDVLQNDILRQVVSHDFVTRETLSSHLDPVLWWPAPKPKSDTKKRGNELINQKETTSPLPM